MCAAPNDRAGSSQKAMAEDTTLGDKESIRNRDHEIRPIQAANCAMDWIVEPVPVGRRAPAELLRRGATRPVGPQELARGPKQHGMLGVVTIKNESQ
jgi:hypothetical protein